MQRTRKIKFTSEYLHLQDDGYLNLSSMLLHSCELRLLHRISELVSPRPEWKLQTARNRRATSSPFTLLSVQFIFDRFKVNFINRFSHPPRAARSFTVGTHVCFLRLVKARIETRVKQNNSTRATSQQLCNLRLPGVN